MKVLHINTEHSWRGGERQTLFTLQGLRDRGIEVMAVCQPSSPLLDRCTADNIPAVGMSMNGSADLLAAWRLSKLFREQQFDVVHAQTSHAASIALLARGFRREPRLAASRRVDFQIKGVWKYNSFNAVLPISKAIEAILRQGGIKPELLYRVPSGVPVPDASPAPPASVRAELCGNGEYLIGAIGALVDHKGHQHLLRAMPKVLNELPGARLVILGEGECRQALEGLIEDLGIESSVNLAGFRPDAIDTLPVFDVLVHPSILEGLATTVLDALARNVPVIASDTGGLPEAVGPHGLLVPPGDEQALARAIVRLAGDGALRKKLVEGSREYVRENYSIDAMVEKTLDVYKTLIEQGISPHNTTSSN